MVDPPAGFNNTICSGATGLRITEFHLARDNESGMFSGNTEVYINSSFYNVSNTNGTLKTNTNSTKEDPLDLYSGHYDFKRGKQLSELPDGMHSATSHTGTIFNVNSGYTPNSGDWVIISDGFCSTSGGNGYTHVYITTFERDPFPIIPVDFGFVYANPEMIANGPIIERQPLYMRFDSDRWLEITLTPADFSTSSTLYLVDPGSGSSYTSITQPSPSTSWFKIELF